MTVPPQGREQFERSGSPVVNTCLIFFLLCFHRIFSGSLLTRSFCKFSFSSPSCPLSHTVPFAAYLPLVRWPDRYTKGVDQLTFGFLHARPVLSFFILLPRNFFLLWYRREPPANEAVFLRLFNRSGRRMQLFLAPIRDRIPALLHIPNPPLPRPFVMQILSDSLVPSWACG